MRVDGFTPPTSAQSGKASRPKLSKFLLLAAVGLVIVSLVMLGNWQLRRLDAKLALIERVENRAFAASIAAPAASDWHAVERETHEYLRVSISGQFLHHRETLVHAVTGHGGGYWVLTPLLTPAGAVYLINRGYVPIDAANSAQRMAGLIDGEVEINGLLRISEPDGAWLRENDPLLDRWYSRDVSAIAKARNLDQVAPFFIDADHTGVPGGLPLGGLTRLQFRNAHLVYALTWYGLALTIAVMALRAVRRDKDSNVEEGV